MRHTAVVTLAFLAACTTAPTPTPVPTAAAGADCRPTVARMKPPDAFLNFVVGGSSQPEKSREHLLAAGNFVGNDAIWVLLPDDGTTRVGGDKFLVWRLKPGVVSYIARRTDGRGLDITQTLDARSGYGDIGFQPGGVDLPTAGCWEVIYQLNGENERNGESGLKFTLLAR